MDLINGMRTFVQVVASGSFTRAAEQRGVSKKLVSKYIAALETHLGTRLLQRTTRSLSLTEAGALYHARCVPLLEELDAMEDELQTQTARPRGRLLISAPVTFGELHLVPLLAAFRSDYPEISVELRLNDRYVSLAEEGFDLAIRIGELEDSALVARKLAPAAFLACASPEYLSRNGTPEHPEDLKSHDCILDSNLRSGANWPFLIDGRKRNVAVSGALTVNSARSARDFALQGCGIAFCPAYVVDPDFESGRLIPLLTDFCALELSVYAVYESNRNLSPKVRAFIDFLVGAFKPQWL